MKQNKGEGTQRFKKRGGQAGSRGGYLKKGGWNLLTNYGLKLTKNQANAKQHPEVKLLLFENYSRSSSTIYPKIKK